MADVATTQGRVVRPEPRRRSSGFWSDALWRVRHDPTTIAALVILGTLVVLALSADVLAERFFHISYSKQDLLNTYRKPSFDDAAWWLGSDRLGRSEVVRLLYGARVSRRPSAS